MPWASGTFGSLLGLPLAWWLHRFTWPQQLFMTVILLVSLYFFCGQVAQSLGGGDPGQIVADEYVAFPLVTLGVAVRRQPRLLLLAFLLFRCFDALKPWPISQIEVIGQGLGIFLDDVMAAIYAWAILQSGLSLMRWQQSRQHKHG